ncbi:MAG: PA14 domain-containing protein [Planctomycetota bacterium]
MKHRLLLVVAIVGAMLSGCAFVEEDAPGGAPADAVRKDIVIADFEGRTYGEGWKVEGEAFGPGPARGTLEGQMKVIGFQGKGLVNTFFKHDVSTGTLTSPPFKVGRKYIKFLIGGGGFAGTTCMNLLIDGKVVRTATGSNTAGGGTEALAWNTWDVSNLAGKEATIQIVDRHTGGWGHISVDRIVQSDARTNVLPSLLARIGNVDCPIFPVPKEYRVKADKPVALRGRMAIVLGEKAEEPETFAASRLTYVLKKRFGLDVPVVTEKAVPKKARRLLILGTLKSNALLNSLKEKHAVSLDSLKGKDPMQDAFAIEGLKTDGGRVVLMIGTTPRSVIYAQYAFLDAVRREGKRVVHPNMSVRDWSALRYRDWWPGNFGTEGVSLYDDTDTLNQITYARANMTLLRGFNSSAVSEKVVKECWRRGLKPYGTINGAVGADRHPHNVQEAKAWLKKGCYGLYISFDDFGMGADPEGLCNKITAVIREHFGEVGDRIAVVTSGGDYFWLNSGQNRRVRGFKDFEEGIFYFTGPPDGVFSTKQHFDQARAAGIKNHIWWHNFPCGARGFYAPVQAPRYYAQLPMNRNCWGRFTMDDLRQADRHMTGYSAQNEAFDLVALQLFWAWDPALYTYENARTAIYRQRHGAAAVEDMRKLDDEMYALTEYYNLMWRRWAFTAWSLKDVSKREEVLALIERMQKRLPAIKAGRKVSYMSDKGYDENFLTRLEPHLDAAKRLASVDFPDYAVEKREGINPTGGKNLLEAHAALSLKAKMVKLLWAGKKREAEAYLADLRKEALPMLKALETKLKDMWYTKEYVDGWRSMLELRHWEPIAREEFSSRASLKIRRSPQGLLAIESGVADCEILYTVDGPPPAAGAAEVYKGPRSLPGSHVVRAVAKLPSGMTSRVFTEYLGYLKTDWKIAYVDSEGGHGNMAANLIDENLDTLWMTEREKRQPGHPHEVRIDLGRETAVQAIGLYPSLRIRAGTPREYKAYVSADGKEWGDPVAAGKFGRIEYCMMIGLKERIKTRFIRLVFLSDFWSTHFSCLKEVDVFDFAVRPAVSPTGDVRSGLRYRYYEEAVIQHCADLAERKPVRQGVIAAPTLDIEGRREGSFGVVYEGYLKAPREGLYRFWTASNDGSILWLDGTPVVDNDGLHSRTEQAGSVSLAAGYHQVRIAFFDAGAGAELGVFWQPPSGTRELLPARVLFHNAE